MDKKTLEVYDQNAEGYANDWLSQPTPIELHDAVNRYFYPAALSADIGCGSGRDVAWLHSKNYQVTGYDASEGLLAFAKKRFPSLRFSLATLPLLAEIADESFDNVLCETVLQHLDPKEHESALKNLLRILGPRGRLIVSTRHPTQSSGDREKDERLYVQVDLKKALQALGGNLATILEHKAFVSSSSGKGISQWVFEKSRA